MFTRLFKFCDERLYVVDQSLLHYVLNMVIHSLTDIRPSLTVTLYPNMVERALTGKLRGATGDGSGPSVALRTRAVVSPSKMHGVFVGKFSSRLGPYQKAELHTRSRAVRETPKSPPKQVGAPARSRLLGMLLKML